MAEKEALGAWRFELLWFKIKPCQKIKITSLSQWRGGKTPLPLPWIDPAIFPFQTSILTQRNTIGSGSQPKTSDRLYTMPQIWGIYRVDDRHGEQSQIFSIAMHFYTVLYVTRDRLQMFDDLVALGCEQTRSSQPLVLLRSQLQILQLCLMNTENIHSFFKWEIQASNFI